MKKEKGRRTWFCQIKSDHDAIFSEMQPNQVTKLEERCCHCNDLQQAATNETKKVSEGKTKVVITNGQAT
jgi:hypothetical protein